MKGKTATATRPEQNNHRTLLKRTTGREVWEWANDPADMN
jgi:hypothetical protein